MTTKTFTFIPLSEAEKADTTNEDVAAVLRLIYDEAESAHKRLRRGIKRLTGLKRLTERQAARDWARQHNLYCILRAIEIIEGPKDD